MKEILIVVFSFAGMSFLFQNCSSEVAFQNGVELKSSVQAINLCEQAKAKNQTKKMLQSLSFEGNASLTCPFNQDDNMDIKNGYIAARIEESQSLQLPVNAVVCGAKFDFAQQDFVYDDHFIFTINDFVVGSSAQWAVDRLETKTLELSTTTVLDAPVYEWGRIVNTKHASDSQTVDYTQCLAEDYNLVSCSWPITENDGFIKLDVDNHLMTALAFENKQSIEFGFITTGDDNPGPDCKHKPIDFNIEVEYVLNQ